MDIALLEELCKIPGTSGFEHRIRNYVYEQIKDLVDEVQTDNLGNLYAIKRGKSSKKLMLAAHLDEIGFMVTHIDDRGFIYFHTLGGFDPKTLTAQRVLIHGKKDVIGVMCSKPIHVMTADERNKTTKITDFFIDTGMSKEEVLALISIGDPITRERDFIQMGDSCFSCKSLDNRIAVFIQIEALRALKDKEIPYDLYAVFTVQEEVGLRGANVSALKVQPDFAIAIDTTIAYDIPGAAAHENVTKLGEGTAIKIYDSGTICDTRMVAFLKEAANRNQIKWQPEILVGGGTDTAGLQRMVPGGSIAGAISIPTRNLHQVVEMVHREDIRASIDLLLAAINEIDTYTWNQIPHLQTV